MKLLIENWQKFINEEKKDSVLVSHEEVIQEYKDKIEKDLYKTIKDKVSPNNVSLTLYKTNVSQNYLFEVKKEDQSKVREEILSFIDKIEESEKKKKHLETSVYKNVGQIKVFDTYKEKNKFTGQDYMQKTGGSLEIRIRAFVDGDNLDFNTNNIKPERIKLT